MTASDYLTAIEVLRLVVYVEVAIRVMPCSRLLDRMTRTAPPSTGVAAATDDDSRLPRFVTVAYDILPFPGTCLRQSLVLYTLLQRRGVPSRFCVGVKTNGATLAAHAWIECDRLGRDAAAATFSELERATDRCSARSLVRARLQC